MTVERHPGRRTAAVPVHAPSGSIVRVRAGGRQTDRQLNPSARLMLLRLRARKEDPAQFVSVRERFGAYRPTMGKIWVILVAVALLLAYPAAASAEKKKAADPRGDVFTCPYDDPGGLLRLER